MDFYLWIGKTPADVFARSNITDADCALGEQYNLPIIESVLGTSLPKPVIIDMDAGVDDAPAIMLAIRSPEGNVRAITAVSGNVHVNLTSLNALRVLEALKVRGIPVAKGVSMLSCLL